MWSCRFCSGCIQSLTDVTEKRWQKAEMTKQLQYIESSSVRLWKKNQCFFLTTSTSMGKKSNVLIKLFLPGSPWWFRTVLLTSNTTGPLGSCSAALYDEESTHIVAGAVEIVPTVHGDVQRMHLGPAVCRARLGEVTWRAEAEVRTPAGFSNKSLPTKRN